MKRYNHRQAAKLIRQKKKQLAAKQAVSRTPVKSDTHTKKNSSAQLPNNLSKNREKKMDSIRKRAYKRVHLSSGWLMAGGIFIFVAAVIIIAFFVFDFDIASMKKDTKVSVQAAEEENAAGSVLGTQNGLTTEFVRSEITDNMMINSSGNFVTVENSTDYYFMDLVFRETTPDGELVNKKVIASEYTLFTYNTRFCNDIIEVSDGYILTGYTQRGDYANGNSDIDIWYAKIDRGANIVWEHVIDDGYLRSQALSISENENGAFQLYIRSESLKRWFMTIDASGEVLSEQDLNEDFVTYEDTSDGGKIFIKEYNNEISTIKKVDAYDAEEFETMIVGSYAYIYEVPEGYLLFGYKEINHENAFVAVLVDDEANTVWEKQVSGYGQPIVKDILYKEGEGFIMTGYIYATGGSTQPRTVTSLFNAAEQQTIEDAWTAKMNETYRLDWERTYAYGDMGSYFDGILEISDNEYYLTGVAQYQCEDASTILQRSIITKISDHTDTLTENFTDLEQPELSETPVINFVGASAINYNILDGGKSNDYALKVYWTDVPGAKQFKVTLYDKNTEITSVITTNFNSYVFENIQSEYGMLEQIPYTAVVTAIDANNGSINSKPFDFMVYNNRYATLRLWYPGFSESDKQSNFLYRLDAGANSVNVARYKLVDGAAQKMRDISASTTETIVEDFTEIGYGTYFYRMTIDRNDNTVYTIDTPSFNYVDPKPEDLSNIVLDEARLTEDVGLNTDDIANLRELIHLGEFDYGNRHHIRLVQLFINYYLGDLAKLGIYSPDTEPESGFDIPIEVNNYYTEDTRKALVYLLAYFGRSDVDGERLSECVDADFFGDIAKLEKQPLRNDIISATRSDGGDAKYNAGYSFDTSYNFIEGAKFALPVDHQPMKSAYFGIRYLPVINGEAYDTGVRLHSGLDFRSEDMIVNDVEYIEAHAGESYIDEADQTAPTEEEKEQTRREIIRDRIYTPYDGVVEYVDDSDPDTGNGIYVRIRHISKDAEKTVFYSQYLHLSSIMCEVGQVLKRGEVIGTMGNTGYSEAKHLHLEFYTQRMHVATFINPLLFDYAYEPLKAEAIEYEVAHGLDK